MYGLIAYFIVRAITSAAQSRSDPEPRNFGPPSEPPPREDWPRLRAETPGPLWQLPEKASTSAAELSSWAAAQFDLSPAASFADRRAAFQKVLADEDFVPSASQQLAWSASSGMAEPAAILRVRAEAEERLEEAVVDFTLRFAKFPAAERLQSWRELLAACTAYPRLAARLVELGPRVAVGDLPVDPDPAVTRLMDHLSELSLLLPANRAVRRRALLRQFKDTRPFWEAATRLKKRHRAVAALDSYFIDRLDTWNVRRRKKSRDLLLLLGSGLTIVCLLCCGLISFIVVANPRPSPTVPERPARERELRSTPADDSLRKPEAVFPTRNDRVSPRTP